MSLPGKGRLLDGLDICWMHGRKLKDGGHVYVNEVPGVLCDKLSCIEKQGML